MRRIYLTQFDSFFTTILNVATVVRRELTKRAQQFGHISHLSLTSHTLSVSLKIFNCLFVFGFVYKVRKPEVSKF